MDKLLYVSYECFKEQSDHGLVIKMKNGDEHFYQVMVSVYKPTKPKWKDAEMIGLIKQDDIAEYIKLPDYLKLKNIDVEINDINLFSLLTKDYKMSQKMTDKIANDINKENTIGEKIYATIEMKPKF